MRNKSVLISLPLLLGLSHSALSQNIKIIGTKDVTVSQSSKRMRFSPLSHQRHTVKLLKIKLNQKGRANLLKRLKANHQKPRFHMMSKAKSSYPEQLNLGMNNTPVLNQGMHGSCVTFANTGAIDALLAQGDYVSQLCSLTLGEYLSTVDKEYPSGWEGSWGGVVLDQLFQYGIVDKETQKSVGCAGMTLYPTYDMREPTDSMTPIQYGELSQPINKQLSWQALLSPEDAFGGKVNGEALLSSVKQSLNQGNRLTFGVLLDTNVNQVGAVGTYHARHDTWMMTPAIEDDVRNNKIDAGHEMIIIGYDDKAAVTDPTSGKLQRGLLVLRNSWSTDAGDNGNYYMTYDYFKTMTDELQTLSTLSH